MIDEQSPASGHDYASNRWAIGAGHDVQGFELEHCRRQLRSSAQTLLEVPNTRLKKYGDKTYAYQAATLSIRSPNTISSFKCHNYQDSYLNSIYN